MQKLLFAAGALALACAACGRENGPETTVDAATAQPLGAAPSGEADTGAPEAGATWSEFVAAYIEDYFALNPAFAVYQGRHDYDGGLPDWSADGLQAQIDLRRQGLADAAAFDPAALNDADRFERDYFMAHMGGELFWYEDADAPHTDPSFYAGALDPNAYVARPYAEAPTRMRAFIDYARNVPDAAAQIQANLTLPLPATYAKFAKALFGGYADYYEGGAKEAFASVEDDALQAEFDAAAAVAAAAMRALAAHVTSVEPTETGYALGAEKFARMVAATEGVDLAPEELTAIGEAELKRNLGLLAAACADFAPDAALADCMAKMHDNKPEGGPVAAARRQLPALRAFIEEKDLVTIPGPEVALVEASPPYNRQNLAYIDIPGPYETNMPSVYYISPPDPEWDEETQRNYIVGEKLLLAVSVHEVWPGHFLNFLHANRADSKFGQIFVGYAFAEGWGLYVEEMTVDAGLNDGDPETRIGQLSSALVRNCRYLSAIGLHAGTMTVEDSRALFRDQCFQEEGTALQQAARGTYDPAYLNYTMGAIMIRKLREDWLAKNYPDATGVEGWKAFHDEFLSYGGPPIPLVRAAMMGEDAPRAVFE